jgi:Protein of unknown function (DUF3435)
VLCFLIFCVNPSYRKIFCFTEVDDLAFDPIIRLLACAVADRAFANDINSMEQLFRLRTTKEDPHPQLCWNADSLKRPIFREAVKTVRGWETSPDKGLTYATLRRHLNRIGEHTGFEQMLNPYNIRRGVGNAVESRWL